jgi:N-sulfoglucosamine sulfohydrolase
MAFAGGKTTVYEGGLRVPFIVRNPYQKDRGNTNNAMLSFVDIVPTLLDFAEGYDAKTGAAKPELAMMPNRRGTKKGPYKFHGRSFLPIVADKNPKGWDRINASHTFHEIQMYYPMRVVRDRKYKLIWNIAHPLPYPFASDLWAAPSWQAQWKKGQGAPYGKKTVREYINRPQFELFDISADPNEAVNLATDAKYAKVLEEYKAKLKKFQQDTQDPWVLKWRYE